MRILTLGDEQIQADGPIWDSLIAYWITTGLLVSVDESCQKLLNPCNLNASDE